MLEAASTTRNFLRKCSRNAPKAELHYFDVDHFESFVGDMPDQIACIVPYDQR